MTTVDDLAGYFDSFAKERAEAVARLVGTFTERELRLIREAASMGYLQGAMRHAGPGKVAIPPDLQIVTEVLDGCLTHSDLYPTITGEHSSNPREDG